MFDMFSHIPAFKDNEKAKVGLSMSSIQKKAVNKVLFDRRPGSLSAFDADDKQDLPIAEEDFSLFKTPSVNQEVKDYIFIQRRKSGNSAETRKDIFTHPLTAKTEAGLYKIDQSARVGMRYAVYGNWLSTTIKKLLLDELGTEHALTEPEGFLFGMIDEAFNADYVQLKQWARVIGLTSMERRRLYMQELGASNQHHRDKLWICFLIPLVQTCLG